jgi:Haem-dependent oxidative N-demethylase, alpha subunit-like
LQITAPQCHQLQMNTLTHTPYDGSKQPFTVGLAPLDLDDWIEPDGNLNSHLAEKQRLFALDERGVFRAEDDTVEAQAEVLALLLDHLPRRFPDLYAVGTDTVRVLPTGDSYRLSDWCEAPLKLAALLVQEDLVLMRKSDAGYRLAAAALCFPSSWSLAEKFGKAMSAIHDDVPGFNDGRMGRIVAKLFDNLSVDAPVWRLNWALYGDEALHQPRPGSLERAAGHAESASLFVRVERQTLRRLAKSSDILFTIRVHHDPVSALAKHPDGSRLAMSLREQLLALDKDQLAYKGLAKQRDAIAAKLADLAKQQA